MTRTAMFRIRTLLLATLVLPAVPLAAQDVPQTVPLPAPTATPNPTPTFVAPITPSPAPTPTATPTPFPTIAPPAPSPVAEEPRIVRPSRRPTPAPTETASPTPAPVPTPTVEPSPSPTADATPPVIASPLPTGDAAGGADGLSWAPMLGAGLLAIAVIGLWLARRQRTPEDEQIGAPEEGETSAVGDVGGSASITPPPTPPAAALPAASEGMLSLRFRPTRVGFNMLSATAEGELTITNEGDAPVHDIRVRTALLGAHVGQDADFAAFLAEAMGRSAVPPFPLAAGEERTVRVLAAAPRGGLRTMTAAGRPIFVPVLAVDLRSGDAQTSQAFAIGVERVDSAKLAPFWLDVPDRAYTEVAARPHGPAVTRRG